MQPTAKHLVALDSQFCQVRLQNPDGAVGGFLWYGGNGLRISNAPLVKLGSLTVNEGDPFGNLVICRANGLFQQVVPADGVDGVLKCDGNGNLSFVDISSSFVLPDPLTVTQLNASVIMVDDITVGGTPTFSGLNTDTITTFIGLNASNELVGGTVPTVSVALFYENDSMLSPATPNYTFPVTPTSVVQIGNEISDPDAIAHVQSSSTILIDKAGDYEIAWYGQWGGHNPGGVDDGSGAFRPGLWLTINGIIVSKGNIKGYQNRNISTAAFGTWQQTGMNVNDAIRLQCNGSMKTSGTGNGTGLEGVTIVLTKIK